jgi:nicotinate-nucleotide adenylyltransferase
MVCLAIENNPRFRPCSIELDRTQTPSWSIDTVRALREELPGDALFFLTGGDQYIELGTWKDIHAILDICEFAFLARPGTSPQDVDRLRAQFAETEIERLQKHWLHVPQIEIASRDIRERIRRGISIRYLVPECVRQFIFSRKLYSNQG